jgi:hypothetical protein
MSDTVTDTLNPFSINEEPKSLHDVLFRLAVQACAGAMAKQLDKLAELPFVEQDDRQTQANIAICGLARAIGAAVYDMAPEKAEQYIAASSQLFYGVMKQTHEAVLWAQAEDAEADATPTHDAEDDAA